jgi:hypothetical protein
MEALVLLLVLALIWQSRRAARAAERLRDQQFSVTLALQLAEGRIDRAYYEKVAAPFIKH